jgi:hypothetical protein
MRLQEFAAAEDQIKLWKLLSDSVWNDIKQQAIEQERKPSKVGKVSKKIKDKLLSSLRSQSASPKKPRPTTSKKPKTVSQPKLPITQKSESAPKTSKQQQKQLPPQLVKPQVLPLVFKNSTRSNRATPQQQSSTSQRQTSANTLQQRPMRQQHDPDSVANTQRQLDPFASSDVVKRLTR